MVSGSKLQSKGKEWKEYPKTHDMSSSMPDVGLFELCNPHLLSTDLLQVTFHDLWIRDWSTSFRRDFFSHFTWVPQNGTRLFTLQGATCHQGLNCLQIIGFGVLKPITKLFPQTSAEKAKKGRIWSRVWPRSSDWGKHGRAEDSWGEVERAAESQVWRRRPCKGGGRTRLQACQDFLAIVATSWKPSLVENYYLSSSFKALIRLGNCQNAHCWFSEQCSPASRQHRSRLPGGSVPPLPGWFSK